MDLITVDKASTLVNNSIEDFGLEEVNYMEALGRVLKEDITADRNFPPFNRVSMDGIAIDFNSFISGRRSFEICGIQAAGSMQKKLEDLTGCFEVMTGAVLPKNTNVVIPYELVTIENGLASTEIEEVKKLQNVHLEGLDRNKADILIRKNTRIGAGEIGVLATVGKVRVKVAKQPKVMVISTGNELVSVDKVPLDHQIRRSNVHTLVALVSKFGIKAQTSHIEDNKEVLKQKIEEYLNHFDVLLFSGAVSKGKFDFIPEVLNDLGVKKLFHRVKQRPGKPFWFGKRGRNTIFAFPGNPVSTFVSCIKYFYPWYEKSMGLKQPERKMAILDEDFSFSPSLTYFLQVKLQQKGGKLYAVPVAGKGSGDLANLVDSDGFLELPDDRSTFTKGAVYPVLNYRGL